MLYDLAVYSKNVLLPVGMTAATVRVRGKRIVEVLPEKNFKGASAVYDAGSHVVMPGLVDSHVHLNEPGRTDWEGMDYGTRAAAYGGVTTLVDMPLNSIPVTTSPEALQEKVAAAKNKLHVNCGFWGGIVPGNSHLLEPMLEQGVMGFKAFLTDSGIDEFPPVDEEELRKAMAVLSGKHVPLLAHAELCKHCQSVEAETEPRSYADFLASRPDHWETDAVKMLIRLSKQYNCWVHVVHVSSAQCLALIAKAKIEGVRITAETCPHYLYFNAEMIEDGATQFKCVPPIRSKSNSDRLWRALLSGTLDFVVSDHSPSPTEMKDIRAGRFTHAWGGISGLQWSLPVTWTVAREKQMSIAGFYDLMGTKVCDFLGLANHKGKVQIGYDADLVIWNPEAEVVPQASESQSRHKLSPYFNTRLFGKVSQTIVNGKLAYDADKGFSLPKGEVLLKDSREETFEDERINYRVA